MKITGGRLLAGWLACLLACPLYFVCWLAGFHVCMFACLLAWPARPAWPAGPVWPSWRACLARPWSGLIACWPGLACLPACLPALFACLLAGLLACWPGLALPGLACLPCLPGVCVACLLACWLPGTRMIGEKKIPEGKKCPGKLVRNDRIYAR